MLAEAFDLRVNCGRRSCEAYGFHLMIHSTAVTPNSARGRKPGMVSGLDRHPRFRRLADYLASKAPAGKLPGRQHIDPVEIPDLLPFLMLIDVLPRQAAQPRYRMRLIGTEVVELHGRECTGLFVEDVLPAADSEAILQGYDEILRSKEAHYRSGAVVLEGRKHIGYDRAAFPLAADGEHVDMLLLVFVRDP